MTHATPVALTAALLASAAAAQTSGPTATGQEPTRIEIQLSNFAFSPATPTLAAGRPYVMRFVNKGSSGHNFSAPAFFAAAKVDPADAPLVAGGKIELAKGEVREVRLVPAAGTFQVRCTHFMHGAFGMKGSISVQ